MAKIEQLLCLSMNRYRELHIKSAAPISIEALDEAIDACLAGGWKRTIPDVPAGLPTEADTWLFYRCETRGEPPTALLAICRTDQRTFYVPNVVPAHKSELSFYEYTAVLKSFCESTLAKLSAEFTIALVFGSSS